eukprot:TRINITY_DN17821_c0_g1_i1.p2 TRINITY_DN17821_c0_g1~~TRINITY_DN17821_c0_g1_i1.p2  ORF type:complete len:132 (-),score=42.78 TRINITY_DN17821_c0_g1_i1:23-391(-)
MATILLKRDVDSNIAIIGDEDTVTGFLLTGIGDIDIKRTANFLVVDAKTSPQKIEETFKHFTSRPDISIVLITQQAANEIRILLDEYEKLVPTVLEIPSKDHPYNPAQDSIMSRLKRMTSQE